MKKIILACSLMFVCFMSQAQIELKTNTLGLLAGTINLEGEYVLGPQMGLSVHPFFQPSAYLRLTPGKLTKTGIQFSWKYYFDNDRAATNFYIAPYLKYRYRRVRDYNNSNPDFDFQPVYHSDRHGFGGGGMVGQKFVNNQGVIFEYNLGLGRFYDARTIYYREFDGSTGEVVPQEQAQLIELGMTNWDAKVSVMIGYRFGHEDTRVRFEDEEDDLEPEPKKVEKKKKKKKKKKKRRRRR